MKAVPYIAVVLSAIALIFSLMVQHRGNGKSLDRLTIAGASCGWEMYNMGYSKEDTLARIQVELDGGNYDKHR